jgi:hypothetical protein
MGFRNTGPMRHSEKPTQPSNKVTGFIDETLPLPSQSSSVTLGRFAFREYIASACRVFRNSDGAATARSGGRAPLPGYRLDFPSLRQNRAVLAQC